MPFSIEDRETRTSASEIKLYVPPDRVDALREWVRARLRPDPNGGGPFGDTYLTNTLYFDTADMQVFQRCGSYGRSKYRVRLYGDGIDLFVERKLKVHHRVIKRRSIVDIREFPRLASPAPAMGWPGYWFHRRLLARGLSVVCQVEYERTALLYGNGNGAIRMTLDRNLRAIAARDLLFQSLATEPDLGSGGDILEMKFHDTPPPISQEIIKVFELDICPISKYRIAVKHLGLQPALQRKS